MEKNPVRDIFGYTVLIAAMLLGLILIGVWIPKVGFMPKMVTLRVQRISTREGMGFEITNPHKFGIHEVVLDVNGSNWDKGFVTNVGFIPGGNETSWVKISSLRKEGQSLSDEATIYRVEVYGYIDNRRCYRRFAPGEVTRGVTR